MSKNMHLISEDMKVKVSNRKMTQRYVTPKTDLFRISAEEREKINPVFKVAQEELLTQALDIGIATRKMLNVAAMSFGNIEFDIDAETRLMEKAVEESGIRHGVYKFLDTVF